MSLVKEAECDLFAKCSPAVVAELAKTEPLVLLLPALPLLLLSSSLLPRQLLLLVELLAKLSHAANQAAVELRRCQQLSASKASLHLGDDKKSFDQASCTLIVHRMHALSNLQAVQLRILHQQFELVPLVTFGLIAVTGLIV